MTNVYVLDDGSSISIIPLAALLTGSFLTLGLAVLLIIVLAVRRNRHRHCPRNHCGHQLDISKVPKMTSQTSRQNSMLEINTGDQRYVVAYTLKPATDCVNQSPISAPIDHQPDILNTPRGKEIALRNRTIICRGRRDSKRESNRKDCRPSLRLG